MGSPKETLEKKNTFAEKYDEIRRLDGTPHKEIDILDSSFIMSDSITFSFAILKCCKKFFKMYMLSLFKTDTCT